MSAASNEKSQVSPIFLFSLPRSGSTLLQRMLAAHPDVATTAEPWLLLPQLYALRERGVYAEYGHQTSVRALKGFCEALPEGEASYRAALRDLTLRLYGEASRPGHRYFLDKTPRYALVASDIAELFPDSPSIILWRNPLAILASVLETWLDGTWRPYHHKVDLYDCLEGLFSFHEARPGRCATLRFEDLLADPRSTLHALLEQLGLPWDDAVVDAFTSVRLQGDVGDPTGVVAYDTVSHQPLDKWERTLASPVRKAWCRRYLRWIGPGRLATMGYDLELLLAELDAVPTAYGRTGGDLADTARGVAWSVLEPTIARDKMSRFPRWHRLYSHT